MQKLLNEWKRFIEGIIPNTKKPNFKYYAFDWDDNLMYMPTKIMLKAEDGSEIGMSTADFAEYRPQIGKTPFDYQGTMIVDYAENPFRNFRVEGDEQFLIDCESARVAPAWPDFVECINEGSYFAIITARGHNPHTLERAVRKVIDMQRDGINKTSFLKSLRKYEELVNQGSSLTNKDLVDKYFENCQFSPVSYTGPGSETEGTASNPEVAKKEAMAKFKAKMEEINGQQPMTIGFSDDDFHNVMAMKEVYGNDPNFTIKYTGPERKEPLHESKRKKSLICKSPKGISQKHYCNKKR